MDTGCLDSDAEKKFKQFESILISRNAKWTCCKKMDASQDSHQSSDQSTSHRDAAEHASVQDADQSDEHGFFGPGHFMAGCRVSVY